MPKIPKPVIKHAKRIASRMRPAPGTKRALAEAREAAAGKKIPPLKRRKPKLALPPPVEFLTPAGRKVKIR